MKLSGQRLHRIVIAIATLAFVCQSALAAPPESGPKGGPKELQELKYRSIGPAVGGRVCRSAGVPGDPLIYYAATASGGVWKTTDGGLTWKPIFDEQIVASIGSIAVAPSDPHVIYVGAGEANIRGNVQAGNGIYKSVDSGKTWKHVWKVEGQIGQLIVHPKNPDIAFAAVLGRVFGPNPDRGVYRTTNGGKSWQQVLAKDHDTGASDVCFDPSNPNILFAGLWQTRRRPWEYTSGGPGSGLYRSDDGGDTWKRLGEDKAGEPGGVRPRSGLPEGIWGKVCIAVAASDPRRVYAQIEAEKGGLYRSDDGGESWKLANGNQYVRIRPWYFGTVHVDPQNADVVWCPAYRLLKSIDGGDSFKQVKGTHHVDHHDIWIDPKNPKRIIDSNDGGVDISTNGGESWYAPPLPIAQFYHINVDNRVPYHVSGSMQDIGAASGPSNSLAGDGIQRCDWHSVGGGEAGHTVHDPTDPNIVYAGEYGGFISRYDHRTRQARNVSVYPTNPSGHGAEDLKYRFQWTAPILISPHDPKTIYHAGNVLFQTTDAGQTWKPISPDLSRNDKTKQKWSGGPITGDNTGVEHYGTIFALAESPRQKGLLWAGSDDGRVHLSTDAGKTWTDVTKNIPGLPEWATVSCIEASTFDSAIAYLVVDAHRLDDTAPYLWKTADLGKTWKSISAPSPLAGEGGVRGLPHDDYLHVLREDPKKKGVLYTGSERGVWFSTDDGGSWKQLKLNLPTVAVHDLRVKDNDLVVGTHGRSIWIFDDLTPIREMSPKIAATEVYVFEPQPGIRWRYHSELETGEKGSDNPPKGVVVHYYLRKKPKDPLKLEITDAVGTVVATLSSKEEHEEPEDAPDAPEEPVKQTVLKTEIGVNRVAWDLRWQAPELIKHAKWDGGNPKRGPLVLPGAYRLKLTVDGQALPPVSFTVEADPRVKLPPTELEAQLKQTLILRSDISKITDTVHAVQAIRKQLKERNELLKDNPKAEPLVKSAKALIDKLETLEAKLHNPKAEVSYNILAQKGGAQLYSKMIALFEWLHDSDGTVTQGMREVYAELSGELAKLLGQHTTLLADDLTKHNEQARKLDIGGVIVPAAKKP